MREPTSPQEEDDNPEDSETRLCVCKIEKREVILKEGLLLGIGSPLVDISAKVSKNLLHKFNLGRTSNATTATAATQKPLYDELVKTSSLAYTAGGSVQNTLRVAQWVLKVPRICTMFGCVGNDLLGNVQLERAQADGLNVQYQVKEEYQTGTCGMLTTGRDWLATPSSSPRQSHFALPSDLGAAGKFTVDHLRTAESQRWINASKIIYTSVDSPDSVYLLAEHARRRKKVFAFDLGAVSVIDTCRKQLDALIPYIDLLFGNKTEAAAFAAAYGFGDETTDLTEIAVKMSSMPKMSYMRQRVVCITQGCDPIILADGCPHVEQMKVEQIPPKNIVDTYGVGDAFNGGFLSQLVLNKPYSTCLRCGMYAASVILQNPGCTFRTECEFNPSTGVSETQQVFL